MKLKHRTLIILAGFVWLAIGTFLLTLGLRFIMETLRNPDVALVPGRFSLLAFVNRFFPDRQNGVVFLLSFALLLGFVKGRYVLGKTAQRQVNRIFALPNPSSIKNLYTKGHYILIAAMMGLGMSLRFIPITLDTRGAIDIAVGSALMNGAMLYFRSAANYHYLKKKES
ncbi:MAG: hypothetical protein S4CHLAM2_02840 [Chlamydiales bacterium]|nr:hypothetical protein [Chlamydiales bacterium]